MSTPEPDWTSQLTDEQRQVLGVLERHRCRVSVSPVPGQGHPTGGEQMMEVKVGAYTLVRERGGDVRVMFDRAAAARIFLTLGYG